MHGPWSLRWWLTGLVVAVGLPLLTLLGWQYASQVRRERAEAQQTALRIARAIAGEIGSLEAESRDCGERFDVPLRQLDAARSLPPRSVVTLVDDDGTILARSSEGAEWIGRNVRGTEVTEIVLREREGRTEATGIDGVSRQYGFSVVPGNAWHVHVGVPTAVVMQPVRDLIVRGALGGAAIILVVTVFALWLSRMIEKPIKTLANAAKAVAKEGFTISVPVSGPREVAELGEAFNAMVENRSRAEAHILESERNLKALSDRLLRIQEEERARIAREIHDELGQALTALKMDVGGLLQATAGDPESARLRARIASTLDQTVGAVQRIASELRPGVLDDLGLDAAIENEAGLFEERTGIECDLAVTTAAVDLPEGAESAVYRIFQEALTNVARHSDASRVEIRLRTGGEGLLLEVRDDGRGITDPERTDPAALGLIGMQERAAMVGGTVEIEGVAGRGTVVSLRVPPGVEQRSAAS